MTNISNRHFSNNHDFVDHHNATEQRFSSNNSSLQSHCLEVLKRMIQVKENNLRNINGDVKNAAVLRDHLLQKLCEERCMSVQRAGVLVASLKAQGKILCFGRFVKFSEVGDKT